MTIRLDGVVVQLPDAPERRLLDDISCTVPDNCLTLLVGRTGAGKSTLIDVLAGLRTPDAGCVWLEENDRTDGQRATARDLNLRCSVMFQSPEAQLFAATVQKELAYNLRPFRLSAEQQRTRMTAGLESAGLMGDWFEHSPIALSHGQKRRVALACAFAAGTPWLFLDEPTAGLDPAARADTASGLLGWRKQTLGSAVIATHDLSTFLPLADQIVILHDGRLHAIMRPQDLYHAPEVLEKAGVGLPEQMKLAQFLRRRGITVSVGGTPEEWAAAIRAGQSLTGSVTADAVGDVVQPAALSRSNAEKAALTPSAIAATETVSPIASDALAFRSLDARAKWLVYILVSAGTLAQSVWPGTLAAAAMAAVMAAAARTPWRALTRPMRPLLIFGALAGAFAGLRINASHPHGPLLSFAWAHTLTTERQLFTLLIVLLYGRMLTLTTTAADLRRALERATARLPFAQTATETLALTASLLLRMLPLVSREWARFSRIVRSRAKSAVKPGRIAPRDAPALLIPLLLALLQRAEDLALAMESRGYRHLGQRRLATATHPMNRRDWFAVVVGFALFVTLMALRRI